MIAYLILENGAVFKGQQFGYDGEAIGELVFTTEAAGYLETLGDPSYYGQIVLQTFPLIGNYGVIPSDMRSGIKLKAYIVRQWCQEPSNFRSEGTLDTFLRQNQIPGLCGIDTRRLTHIIRENGVMNAMISKTPGLSAEQWDKLRGYEIKGGVSAVCDIASTTPADAEIIRYEGADRTVALISFGSTRNIADELVRRGVNVAILRYDTSADAILATKPDGIVLSDGPGNPAENTGIVETLKALRDKKIPTLGIGLGHQLLALSRDASTKKLPFGHRGANQPVRETGTGRVFVTSQNHGYTVDPSSLPAGASISYENCNDGTCEGIAYEGECVFSVQFWPDEDSKRVYDTFVNMLGREKTYAVKA